ncbi:hypothetical protein [Nostoc sp.]|uniref:hypothetical protein n=1 Tax=Nostoc sp. TaxID=1180 RepID=UPI002FF98C0A
MKLLGHVYLEVRVCKYSDIRILESLHTQVSAMIITGACGCVACRRRHRLPPTLGDAPRSLLPRSGTASLFLACLRKAPPKLISKQQFQRLSITK